MEPYTKECGCCCHDWVEDVDRPFMSYTDRGTTVISYCERHGAEAEKTERREEEETKQYEQYKATRKQQLDSHKSDILAVEHQVFVPIKYAALKQYPGEDGTKTPRHFTNDYCDLRLITKVKNRWVCTKEKLDRFFKMARCK